jgi:D-apiose dehydrogenase
MTAPLKGALLGAGFFAQYQAEAWSRLPGVELVAVADPRLAAAEDVARRFGIPRAYSSAETLLQQEAVDYVDIATRPDTHLPLTRLAASHGTHIICQKPMAPTWEECAAMVEAARQAGVRLLIHENWRWQPWYRELRRLLEGGALGRLFHLGFRLRTGDGRGPEPYPAQPYFREMERFLVQESLVHFLDTARFLAGEIREVWCRTGRINPVIRGEDCALIHLDFESGAGGLIDSNRISGPNPPDLTFGTLVLEGDAATARLATDGTLWLQRHGEPERPHPYDWPDTGYRGDSVFALQAHLASCLRTGAPAESDGETYLRTAAAVFACYASAEKGRLVRLEELLSEMPEATG